MLADANPAPDFAPDDSLTVRLARLEATLLVLRFPALAGEVADIARGLGSGTAD